MGNPEDRFSRDDAPLLNERTSGWGGGNGIVRMCVPNDSLFQRCQVYDWPPFSAKSI